MPPCLAIFDATYVRLAQTVRSGDCIMGAEIVADIHNVLLSKTAVAIIVAALIGTSPTPYHVVAILLASPGIKVIRVDTKRIVAAVQYPQPLRDFTMADNPRAPVR